MISKVSLELHITMMLPNGVTKTTGLVYLILPKKKETPLYNAVAVFTAAPN